MTTEEATEKGEEIAEKYNKEGVIPFPFERIKEDHEDLLIYKKKLNNNPETSGLTLFDKEDNKFLIVINKNKSINRQYFTMAHELGHYFLHKDVIKSEEALIDKDQSLDHTGNVLFRLDYSATTKIEREANNFAAALIMPEKLVREVWKSTNDVDECTKIFQVSLSAMSIRLEQLNLAN